MPSQRPIMPRALLLSAGFFLLVSCKPTEPPKPMQPSQPAEQPPPTQSPEPPKQAQSPEPVAPPEPPKPPKIVATDTGTNGPGAQTIKGGNVTFSLSAEGKPQSYSIGDGPNLLRPNDPGPGFYLTTGSGTGEKTIPFVSAESKDGKLIFTAADNTRVTLAVNAGDRFVSFRLETIEDVPKDTEPALNFLVNFQRDVFPELVPFDYMCLTGGRAETVRSYSKATWPYLWKRGAGDPLGGFALFVPRNDEEHNEALLRIWTEEKVPHPKVNGPWTYEAAKKWAAEWKKNAEDTTHLMISAEKPGDLDSLIEYAKKMKVKRVYLHTDTWRGAYWLYDREPLSVNTKVFPRGEVDLKAFIDKLHANGMGAMMHSLCYGFGPEGSKYIGKGIKTDHRLANWGKGRLEQLISETDTTILFRPDPGVKFPDPDHTKPWPQSYPKFFSIGEILVDDEIIPCTFEHTDGEVWTLTASQRGASATKHEAGAEILGLLKAYNQNYYPDSMTELPEITAKEYAEFFNRLGVQHHEYDGKECHDDVPWGFAKWSMFVYQNSQLPITSNTSSGGANPWDLMYRFKSNGADKVHNKGSNHGSGSGTAALALARDSRPATSPIENHFTMALAAVANSPGYVFGKPEPMFGIFPNVIHDHGLADLIAEQFSVWREVAPKLTPELRKKISDCYYRLNPESHHPSAKIVYEARRAGGAYELQPFTIMTRGAKDADWTTVQEFSGILPRQYVAPGMRVSLDNPFGRQAPQFIIRVLNGYTEGRAERAPQAPKEQLGKDMQGYLIAAGANPEHPAPVAAASVAADTASFRLQPKAVQITNPGQYHFADVGPALEVSLDNSVREEPPAATPSEYAATSTSSPVPALSPAPSPTPKPGTVEHFQQEGFPSFACEGNAQNARGVALTVTGDGSGAFLIVQIGPDKDYVVPIDFQGRKEIFIPIGEAARNVGRWGMRYKSKRAGYGAFHSVSIGFGRVPANTRAKVLIENLRMVGEQPSSIINPVIHAGAGTLRVQGEVKTDQYLWYQGGDSVGVYDLNWNLQTNLPVVLKNYAVDTGFSDFWIDGQAAKPAPWFDVQFITKGEVIKIDNAVPAANPEATPAATPSASPVASPVSH